MPYYSELGIYTPSSSYTSPLLKGPYSSHSSILASNILPPSSKQFNRSNFRGFKPHLTPINESNISAPLRRINSPKVLYHTSPKVRAARPIKINTSDIDVSLNKYSKYAQPPSKPQKNSSENEPQSAKKEPASVIEKEAKPNREIRRDRATIRLQTIHKDTLEKEIGQIKSWRDNFQPDELAVEAKRRKKTPGELLKEKFLIRSKSKENVPQLEPPKLLRKNSVKKSPSFKDICNEITSDQTVEDLNPGQPFEVRRRQSRQLSHDDIIKEIQRSSSTLSVEEVQILDALLQAENEVGLYDVPPDIKEPPKSVRKRKVTKKKSSENLDAKNNLKQANNTELLQDEDQNNIPDFPEISYSRLRKDSSLIDMVKDISQVEIEMIPVKQKPVITGYIGSIDEKTTNNLKAIVGDLEIQESPQKEKKEKKFRFNVTVQEFPVKKTINAPKCDLGKDNYHVTQVPNAQIPVITSILKKREEICIGQVAGDGQVKEKIIKKKLIKSFSEVQVKNKDEIKVKRSESNDSLHSNFTVMFNKSRCDENLENDKNSLHGSGKLKIISIKDSLDKAGQTQAVNNTTIASDNKVKVDDKESIPKVKPEVDKVDFKEEVTKANDLLKITKKDLKADTFLCKTELGKTKNVSNLAHITKRDQTSHVEETEEIKMPLEKTINSVELKPQDNESSVEDDMKSLVFPGSDDLSTSNENNVVMTVKDLDITFKENEILDVTTKDEPDIVKEPSQDESPLNKFSKKGENNNTKDLPAICPKKVTEEELTVKTKNKKDGNFWENQGEEKSEHPKLSKLKLQQNDPKILLKEISKEKSKECPESPEEKEKRIMSKRSLVEKANKSDPDLQIFEPPTPPPPEPVKEPSPEPSFVPLQSNRLSQWMHPWKKPEQRDECSVEIFAKPKFIRARHIPRRWRQNVVEDVESEDSETSDEDSSSDGSEEDDEKEEEIGAQTKIGASTSSDDSGFDSGRTKTNGSIDSRDSPAGTLNPASNPAFALDFNDLPEEVSHSSTYQSFQRSGRITPPATTIPRFRKYCVDDFNFLKVLGKGSFGKVLLAELKGTEYYYAIKCLKKDVVLEDDDVECTLIERKVLALGTKHPYLCHLLCTFQTESHLFFVMEYLNGGDLMFHIQAERRFSEARARFYGAEIVSGLRFLHNKGIVYRDLKLDNILLDFDGHVRIADFGMCKLQIFLDRMADTFCGTPDYMAPEIIKGQHYNQCVDWWSFGVLLYEMLLGQSPFSGSDEDELFWSICNEKPVIPRFLSAEAGSVLLQFLEKDSNKRLGHRFSPHGDIQDHAFFKPIDWAGLEARHLEPPFKPNLQHPLDTQYFDKTFTTERAKLTPIETGILQSMDQTQFQGFSYTNPNATDK